jgi:UDP-4-amino-4-deoxy-L-arabinose formyltransferase/UDP-glucuronic acid dehydrogenase (UDP-4-keto-hexauronic acid decarboxylating)
MKTVQAIASTRHDIICVFARQPRADTPATSMWTSAQRRKIPVMEGRRVRDPQLAEELRAMDVDLLLSVRSPHIVHPAVIAAPRIGSFNLHSGPLPQYAGLNVGLWAIYNGESQHGVTVHRMTAEIDAGDIAYQAWFPIEPSDTGLTVIRKGVEAGIPLLLRLVADAEESPASIPAIAQDLSQRRYYGKAAPQGGVVDWSAPAARVVNHVRACDFFPFTSPWGIPLAYRNDQQFGIVKATASNETCRSSPGTVAPWNDDSVRVAAGDQWVIVHTVMIGDERLPATQFLYEGDQLAVRPAAPSAREC